MATDQIWTLEHEGRQHRVVAGSNAGWLRWLLDKAKYVWPVVLAYVLARAEIKRRREQERRRAEQAAADESRRQVGLRPVAAGCDAGRVTERNVLGGELEPCGTDPMTGFFRDGCCNTGPEDRGSHTICAVVTAEFLDHQRGIGNDLSRPMPQYGFPGLVPGDRWCVTALNWARAHRDGAAAPVVLASTNAAVLSVVPLEAAARVRGRRTGRPELARALAVPHPDHPAERGDVRRPVGAERHRGVVVVEQRAGAGADRERGLAGARVDRGEVPGAHAPPADDRVV